MANPPILSQKHYEEKSVFIPENLLREARRQKSLRQSSVPRICLLDPDGDIVRWLIKTGNAELDTGWACYHTNLYNFNYGEVRFGIIGSAVGASFAVLVAEELFSSGCELLISVTSAGQIETAGEPPYFILIEKAVRDEGTSYHYLPPADFSYLNPDLQGIISPALTLSPNRVFQGTAWTTDAPFRETAASIDFYRKQGVLAVEMEAAALYAFAESKKKDVICLAHVTNRMAQVDGDFEKGFAGGSQDALQVVGTIARAWLANTRDAGASKNPNI